MSSTKVSRAKCNSSWACVWGVNIMSSTSHGVPRRTFDQSQPFKARYSQFNRPSSNESFKSTCFMYYLNHGFNRINYNARIQHSSIIIVLYFHFFTFQKVFVSNICRFWTKRRSCLFYYSVYFMFSVNTFSHQNNVNVAWTVLCSVFGSKFKYCKCQKIIYLFQRFWFHMQTFLRFFCWWT